jgi:hypothetical protein
MNTTLRDELGVPARAVALHPGILFPDTPFILPQVIERRNSERDAREASLAEALRTTHGNWTRLWYDEDEECFHYCHTKQDPEDAPEYPGFVWDCLNALGESFYLEPEHPLQTLIREQQQLYI